MDSFLLFFSFDIYEKIIYNLSRKREIGTLFVSLGFDINKGFRRKIEYIKGFWCGF